MERFGTDPIQSLTDEQKEQLKEVDSLYASKIAQVELQLQTDLKKLSDRSEAEALRKSRLAEIQSLKEKAEREKNKIRQANS